MFLKNYHIDELGFFTFIKMNKEPC